MGNLMKKMIIWLIGALLVLTSCVQNPEEEIVQNEDEQEQEISIVPSYKLSEENYKMILPFRPSKARGVIGHQMANRLDIDEMEEGLRRHSKEVFDPEKYYFEEGQYLTEDMIFQWLGRYPTEQQLERDVQREINRLKRDKMTVNEERIREQFQQGLNPPIEDDNNEDMQRENPRYLSHVLEQNFLERKDNNTVELVGVSIGIALKSVYRFQTETGGPYYYEDIPMDEMLAQGKEIAQTILERLRQIEGLEDVPILMALYREQEAASPVPGNYVAKTLVNANDMTIKDWQNTNEEYVLFPSDAAKENYYDDYEIMNTFGNGISEYFPNYVGYVGEGFYINGELKRLSIEIPIQFYSKGEILGFTQYTYGLVMKLFSNYYDLEVKVTTDGKVESLIYREAGEEEPIVHIMH